MMNGIMEHFRKDSGLTQAQFKKASFYLECEDVARDVTSEMQNSAVIVDFRAISEWIQKVYLNELLVGPTGHSYLVTEHTFRTAYPNLLISYEFALIAQATCEALEAFPSVEVLGHYHDGNVVVVPIAIKDEFLKFLGDKVTSIGKDLGLRYPQKIECKEVFPHISSF